MLEIINANDIAKEMETILGDRYRIFVDNNTGYFRDIPINMNPEEKIGKMNEKIWGIMTTDTGELVALKGLFTASFGFTVMFYVPTDIDISPDLNRLIETLNGSLQEVGNSKYLMTFYTPSAIQGVEIENGEFYQRIVLSGNIAVTEKSVFGNEVHVNIFIDNNTYSLDKSIISGTLNMQSTFDTYNLPNTYITLNTIQSINSFANFTLHFRVDDSLLKELFKIAVEPDLLLDKQIKLRVEYDEVVKDWNVLISNITTTIVIGGYLILDVGFVRTVVI